MIVFFFYGIHICFCILRGTRMNDIMKFMFELTLNERVGLPSKRLQITRHKVAIKRQ